jgi:3-oxoacyl-[acyl-carrier protein] reductase
MTPEEWHHNIDLNLNGPFYCSHEALARFARRGGGFIVNISSLAGKNAFSGGAGYNASKAGLNAFTEALMLDHRHDNVRVCSIMPGSVDTEFSGDRSKPLNETRAGDTTWMIAPEDIAETVGLVLSIPTRTMISRVEMRPSRPKK